MKEPSNVEWWLLVGGNKPYKMSLWLFRILKKSSHSRSIAVIKRPTVWVWLPFGMNKHTNMVLWLAERVNEPSNVELWLLVGGNKPYKMSLWLFRILKKSSHSRSIAVIKRPTVWVWLPFGINKQTNMVLWLAERVNEPSNVELWLLVGGNKPYKMSLWLFRILQEIITFSGVLLL